MIRLLKEEDILKAAELESLCFSDAWSEKLLRDGLFGKLESYFVLEEEGQLCGYCCVRIVAGEGEVGRLAVHPGFRGRGFGKKLMEQMVLFARKQGVEEMTLEVRAGNTSAIKLYESCGFSKEAVRNGYYKEPTEDALIMWNRHI